ncbi:hypothetical protein KKC1_01640 [Calderihabitans maritimus]|uniref:Uncharacterized protein n=1 Tax=Calderihabitans maritimus TaxID=1246530 RepID=A0A1Z5HN98_9FIRM|nr:hypothetical protein KKC1_01640 [Calderihabitans maritimus]
MDFIINVYVKWYFFTPSIVSPPRLYVAKTIIVFVNEIHSHCIAINTSHATLDTDQILSFQQTNTHIHCIPLYSVRFQQFSASQGMGFLELQR